MGLKPPAAVLQGLRFRVESGGALEHRLVVDLRDRREVFLARRDHLHPVHDPTPLPAGHSGSFRPYFRVKETFMVTVMSFRLVPVL